jgi:hypothetical protein
MEWALVRGTDKGIAFGGIVQAGGVCKEEGVGTLSCTEGQSKEPAVLGKGDRGWLVTE